MVSYIVGLLTILTLIIGIMTPIIKLTKAITELTHTCKDLAESFDKSEEHNKESRKKIWEYNDLQDRQIRNHELRLHDLDGKWFEDK